MRWLGGLRFAGWLAGTADRAKAQVAIDGQMVMEVAAEGWTHIGTGDDDPRVGRSFSFHAPDRFADGLVHRLSATGPDGEALSGGPVPFLAFADGLEQALAGGGHDADRRRAEFFDRLLPQSLPMSRYAEWRDSIAVPETPVLSERVAFIAVGAGDIDGSVESLQAQTHRDWVAASLPPTEGPFAFRTGDAADFLIGEAADCAIVVFAPAGSRLETNALGRLAQALFGSPDALAAYGDLAVLGEDGAAWPLFFPAFDHERQLEQGYAALCFAVRRDVAERAVTAGASDLYRLFNAAIGDGSNENAIVHVPGVVATLPPFDLAAASLSLAEASLAHLQAAGDRRHGDTADRVRPSRRPCPARDGRRPDQHRDPDAKRSRSAHPLHHLARTHGKRDEGGDRHRRQRFRAIRARDRHSHGSRPQDTACSMKRGR